MLIRQTLLYLPAQLLGPLSQFVAAVAWTHWLAPGAYGVLFYIIASQELAFTLCLSWWSHYTMRYLGGFSDAEARRRYQEAENAVMLAAALLQALVAYAILWSIDRPITPAMFAITALFIITRSATAHLSERARARGQITIYTLGQSIGPVVGFAFAWIIVSQWSATPEGALAGFSLAQAIGLAWMWRAMRLGAAITWPARSILAQALAYGAPLIGAGVIGWVSVNGIRVIVEHFRGAEAVGLISVGWGLGQRLASVVAMLVTAAAFPLAVQRFQAGAREDAIAQLATNGALLLALIAPACGGVIMLTPEAVDVLIAEPFRAVTMSVLPLAVLGGAVRNLRVHFADQIFLLFERTGLMMLVNIIEALMIVAFCAFGLWWGGYAGATAGCLAGALIGAACGFGLGSVQFGLRFPFAHARKILIATLFMILALALPQWPALFPGEASRLIAKTMIGALIYAAVLTLLYPACVAPVLEQLQRMRANEMKSRRVNRI